MQFHDTIKISLAIMCDALALGEAVIIPAAKIY